MVPTPLEVERVQQDDRARVYVRVSGRVQGVFFRDSTREKAQELGLSGYVKNMPDGDVAALFEGPTEGVEEMIRWCGQGAPHAARKTGEPKYATPPAALL